jgi:hypothetical protein
MLDMNQEENTPWQYKPDDSPDNVADEENAEAATAPAPKTTKNISWEASEFIDHHQGSGWYALLALATIALGIIVFFMSSHDIVATIIILVLGVVVGLFAGHKPAVAKYEITRDGLKVNNKVYKYGDYKSFAVIDEGQLSSVNLIPLKRFLPPVSAYFEDNDEKKITEALGNYLPYEPRKLDAIERLSRRLRL